MRTIVLPAVFLVLLAFGAWRTTNASPAPLDVISTKTAEIQAMRRRGLPEPGVFPPMWINGADCGTESPMQSHAYNDDLYIIRQSKCETFEAPFLFLIFGDDMALLMDTGSNPLTEVAREVNELVKDWLERNNRTSIPLIVAHTHAHGDHIQGDSQLAGLSYAQVIPADFNNAIPFWGFTDYPNDVPTIDLGGRVIDVIGTPGHQGASVTLYDRRTELLLSGDIVYPGHLFIFSQPAWLDFVDSIQRLVDWAATHPVKWVVGCHIEMSATPGMPFQYTTPFHPNEHLLQLPPTILADILAASLPMGTDPDCAIFDHFVIHPVYKCGILWNG